MAQNVTIAGNQYPDVPSILVPKTGGGGNAVFADPSVVTAVAADVASGKYFLDSSGVLTQGTASGGGGASNIVTGTFKGTTTNAAMDVTLNYSGSGYPVCVVVFPTGGIVGNSSFNSLLHQYAFAIYLVIKRNTRIAPKYTNANPDDDASILRLQKSSTSSATSYTTAGNANTSNPYHKVNATSSTNQWLRICSATKLSVYIAATSYGFPANIEYTYYVIYSS